MGNILPVKKLREKSSVGIMLGIMLLLAVVVVSSLWLLETSQKTTKDSVYDVSALYLEELTKQRVNQLLGNLDSQLQQLQVTVDAMRDEDVADRETTQKSVGRMRKINGFDFYALVDEAGTLYTESDIVTGMEEFPFLDGNCPEPKKTAITFSKKLGAEGMVLASMPVTGHVLDGRKITAAVGGIAPRYISTRLSLESDTGKIFCEIFKADGTFVLKTNHDHLRTRLNLLTAMEENADFTENTSLEGLKRCLKQGKPGIIAYYLEDILHYTYYAPVEGTDWFIKTTIHYDLVSEKVDVVRSTLFRNSMIQMCLVILVLFVGFMVYLSIRRRNEKLQLATLQAQESSRAKSAFLSNMSHDIRTPMNAIIGFTTLAMKCEENVEKIHEYLKKILASSNHLLTLINDVLEMSRIESGKIYLDETECNLSEILHDLNTIIIGQIEEKQQELMMDAVNVVNEDVFCDRLRLNQVLLNLLSNAIKFTPAKGKICVFIEQKDGAPEGYGIYVIRVKDTGIGMTKEFAENVFKPFERERTSTVSGIQGTGLGMAITKSIVDMMEGTIEVVTAPGQGTEYIIQINLRLQDKQREPEPIAELTGVRALVVDDDFDTCDATSRMLKKLGIQSEWTMSGKEAILRTKQSQSMEDDFGIYIIDWRLPDLRGSELAKQIRSIVGSEVPILVMTAYDWADIEEEARGAGVTAFCSKPVFMSDLQAALSRAIGKQVVVAEEIEEEKKFDFSGKKVLLVEDNELNREIAVEILSEVGIQIEEAENGAIALEKVQNATPGQYDLVLMDIQMPVMDGYEACRRIRALEDEERSSIVIVAMTANAFEEDKMAAIEAGMNGHIAKPLDVEVLFETLAEIFAGKAGR